MRSGVTTRPITLIAPTILMTLTTISVSKETHRRLKAIGQMGESYDDVVKRLLDLYEKMERLRLKKPDYVA